jgi:hypothetical protein
VENVKDIQGEDLIIARIDVTKNEVNLPYENLPTVLFYKKDKGQAIPYSGDGSKTDLTKFIFNNLSNKTPSSDKERNSKDEL